MDNLGTVCKIYTAGDNERRYCTHQMELEDPEDEDSAFKTLTIDVSEFGIPRLYRMNILGE